MKNLFVSILLTSLSANIFAATLKTNSFEGKFKLLVDSQGFCAPELKIIKETFANQRAPHSLGIYGIDGAPETNIIYQLTGLNSGMDFHFTTEPMFGTINGSWYSLETLTDNKITAETIVRSQFGIIQWRNKLVAELIENKFSYIYTDYNILSGSTVARTDVCTYIKL
jgi:hypothetical protein